MKNIKDITLSIFAVIGFVALLSSFTQEVVYTEKQISNGTPESHEWSVVGVEGRAIQFNKVTGEANLLVISVKGGTTVGLKSYTAKPTEYGDDGK
jgi:hypothetical protein